MRPLIVLLTLVTLGWLAAGYVPGMVTEWWLLMGLSWAVLLSIGAWWQARQSRLLMERRIRQLRDRVLSAEAWTKKGGSR